MADGMRAHLLRWLKVPADPAPPPGGGVRTFRASRNYYRYTIALWLLKQASALFGLYISYQFLRGFVGFQWLVYLELLAIIGFVAQLPFSFALLKLNFEMRWYMLSDRSLRIREGILSVHEQTMAFANIQNISIRQNPLQRLCGISTVVVRAAGGGSGATSSPYGGEGGKSGTHEATFEGVDNAEEIRSVIRERIRLHRDAGLGDPDDPAPRHEAPARRTAALSAGPDLSGAIAAAERVLAEARALRRAAL
jgi:membrane protein YdbS with pleckstrin-like domain